MRLLAIRPVNFRAFGRSGWMPLDSDLIVFQGANGSGKTSLAEAVEWLLFGETRRRERGDGFSKLEYKGSYTNVHADGPVEVSARVRTRDGAVRVISRRLTVGPGGSENSQTFVDGRREELVSLGIPAGRDFYPVVTQHGLQEFIHAGPKERRDAFCALAGLETLSAFRSALDRARYSLNRSVPPEVSTARGILARLRPALSANPDTTMIAQKWDDEFKTLDPSVDWPAMVKPAQKLAHADERDPDRLIEILEAQRSKALGGVPVEVLGFWEAGLGIVASRSSPTCPMCGEQTFSDARRGLLSDRVARYRGLCQGTTSAARGEASGDMTRLNDAIASLRAKQAVETVAAYNRLKETAASEAHALEGFLLVKLREALAPIEEEIASFYNLLNPDSPVRFSRAEPGPGLVKLLAEAGGEEMSAAACLSTCQLNCLGLAIHLVRATRAGSPFDFLVLDDPFQAMDADHCERLMATVLPRLSDRAGKQILLFTHSRDLATRACELHASRSPLRHRIETTSHGSMIQLPG